jgi:hypothetical protein
MALMPVLSICLGRITTIAVIDLPRVVFLHSVKCLEAEPDREGSLVLFQLEIDPPYIRLINETPEKS